MSYGRLGWREWSTEQQRVVGRNAAAFCGLAEGSIELIDLLILCTQHDTELVEKIEDEGMRQAVQAIHKQVFDDSSGNHLLQKDRHNIWQWLRNRRRAIDNAKRQIERLADTFKLAKDGDGAFPGGEELPVKFEIAQQLHRQLHKHCDLFVDVDVLREDASKSIDSDCAWSGALQRFENSAPTDALKRLQDIVDLQKREEADQRYSLWEQAAHWKQAAEDITPKEVDQNFHQKTQPLRCQVEDFKTGWKAFHALMSRPEARLSFEELAKTLLVDECPHAMLLLRRGLLKNDDIEPEQDNSDSGPQAARDAAVELEHQLDLFNIRNKSNLKRGIDGIREMPSRYRILTPFKFDMFDKIRASARGSNSINDTLWDGFTKRLEELLGAYRKKWELAGDKRVYLTPMSRFLVPVYLAMCKDPFKALGVPEGKISEEKTKTL